MTKATLNRHIARRVDRESGPNEGTLRDYAGSMACAWPGVVDRMMEAGFRRFDLEHDCGVWKACFRVTEYSPKFSRHGETAAEAICRAALDALDYHAALKKERGER